MSSLGRASTPIGERPVPDLITEIPGPKAREHVKFDEEWTSPSLPRAYPIVPVRGAGMAIEDIDGNLFLDFAAGIAVNSTGHAHPRVVGAIKEQASELIHYSASDFYLPVYAEAARELARIAPISGKLRTYLGNSGTEMVEAAMKLTRHATGRQYIVGFLGGVLLGVALTLAPSGASWGWRGRPFGVANAPCSLARSCRIGCVRTIWPSQASCTEPATIETSTLRRRHAFPTR